MPLPSRCLPPPPPPRVQLKKSTWDKREAEATEDDVEAAAKRLKENPTGGGKTAKHKRKHINILHN